MAWQKILLLSVALFIGNTSALRKRILNSHLAEIEDFPYQVSLQNYDDHYCGGSIISEKHILTAGHCTKKSMKPPYNEYIILTGTSHLLSGGKQHEIANVTVHPDLKCDGNRCVHDIAVITLKNKIVFDKYQKKIDLPKQNYIVGNKANVTGWGTIQLIPIELAPEQLRMIETKIISMEDCQKKVVNVKSKKTQIYDTELCTFHSIGTGACFGDSGGPLVVNGELVGIVSWADGKYCADGHADVFTNVYKYIDFIKSATNQTV